MLTKYIYIYTYIYIYIYIYIYEPDTFRVYLASLIYIYNINCLAKSDTRNTQYADITLESLG